MRLISATLLFIIACAFTAAAEDATDAAGRLEARFASIAATANTPPRLANERVVLRTNIGDIVLVFYPDVAPEHTAQILKLVRAGVYDGLDFYRVEPSFVAQLSDARSRRPELSDEQSALIRRLAPEFGAIKHERGVLSMARYEDRPDSAETSFSILLGDAPHLDGKFTVFGRVEAGYDVLAAIAGVNRWADNRPIRPVVIRRAEVVESHEALSSLALRGPDFSEQQAPLFLLLSRWAWALGAAAFFGLAVWAAAARGRLRAWAGSVGLLVVFVGFFGLLIALLPHARNTGWPALLLFAGVVTLFKLMNRFENGRLSPNQK